MPRASLLLAILRSLTGSKRLARPALCPPQPGLPLLELALDGFCPSERRRPLDATSPPLISRPNPTNTLIRIPLPDHRTFAYLTLVTQHSSLTSTP
jgi:hypothetical protein